MRASAGIIWLHHTQLVTCQQSLSSALPPESAQQLAKARKKAARRRLCTAAGPLIWVRYRQTLLVRPSMRYRRRSRRSQQRTKRRWRQPKPHRQQRKQHPQRRQRPEPEQEQEPGRVQRREREPEPEPALPSCRKRPALRLQSGSPVRAISSFQVSFYRTERKTDSGVCQCRRMAALAEQPRDWCSGCSA
jgi:hypothetical protein